MSDKKNSDELNSGNGFLDKVDVFFAKRENGLFWLSLFGLILFSLLHFQANIRIVVSQRNYCRC